MKRYLWLSYCSCKHCDFLIGTELQPTPHLFFWNDELWCYVCLLEYVCEGNTSLQIDHHSSTGKDRGGVSERTLTQPIMNRVVIMRNPLPLNRGHWSNSSVCLIFRLACIVWSRVSLCNSFHQSSGSLAHSSVLQSLSQRSWGWRKVTLVAAVNLGGAVMRKVSLVLPETTVSWTEKDEFSHLGTDSH